MLKKRKTIIATAALLGCAVIVGFSQKASADSFTYYTEGYFTGTDAVPAQTAASTNSITSGADTNFSISFAGAYLPGTPSPTETIPLSGPLSLGTLSISGSDGALSKDTFTGDYFNLEVFQETVPATGLYQSPTLVGTFVGNVNYDATSSGLVITFAPATFNAPTTDLGQVNSYFITSPVSINTAPATITAGVTEQPGTPTASPLPSSALAGFGLLSLLGFVGLKSKHRSSAL